MLVLGLVIAAVQVAAAPPPPPQRPLIDGLCLHVAAGVDEGGEYARLLGALGARPLSASEGGALTPTDEPTAGQVFRFAPAVADAPVAVIEPRRGQCALVWEGAALPAAALAELADGRPKTGPDGAPERWRKVSAAIITRVRPPRWFIQVGPQEGQGVCADALTDLRRRDKQAVSMLRLAPCRLDAAEKVEAP